MRTLKQRKAAEARFRFAGRAAIALAVAALLWLVGSVVATGAGALTHHRVEITAADAYDPALLSGPDLRAPASDAPADSFRVLATARLDQHLKGREAGLTEAQVATAERWRSEGRLSRGFNTALFTRPDSRDPERAGLKTALLGSLLMLALATALSLPLGVVTAVYLDSFAPRRGWGGRLSRVLEININNLAAVPAIVFGLLGLAVFINLVGLERGIALVGGLVLGLRMFPTVVISSRAALASVPASVTDSALCLGASPVQVTFGTKLPMAAPGIITGSILALAQALGETAPLLLIGMVAFMTTAPSDLADPATSLPVQIFLWSDGVEPAWAERTAAAILALLALLLVINISAAALRARLDRRRA